MELALAKGLLMLFGLGSEFAIIAAMFMVVYGVIVRPAYNSMNKLVLDFKTRPRFKIPNHPELAREISNWMNHYDRVKNPDQELQKQHQELNDLAIRLVKKSRFERILGG